LSSSSNYPLAAPAAAAKVTSSAARKPKERATGTGQITSYLKTPFAAAREAAAKEKAEAAAVAAAKEMTRIEIRQKLQAWQQQQYQT